jgi:hypothetical protein
MRSSSSTLPARVPRFAARWVPGGNRWLAVLAVFGLVGWLHGGEMQPSPYQWRQATFNTGGGVSSSVHYRLESSLAVAGGLRQSADGSIADRSGFAGALNGPPLPEPDTVHREPGQPLRVPVASLLANDHDPDSDPLRLHRFDAVSVAGGRVTWDNGWLLYEPPSVFPDADSFTYAIEDAAGNVVATLVTVLIAGTGPMPSLNQVTISFLSNGHRRVSFAGIAQRRYTIEWAEDLTATRWKPLSTVEADARGVVEWADVAEPAPAGRYYRTVAE